jgi:hypothetical protein
MCRETNQTVNAAKKGARTQSASDIRRYREKMKPLWKSVWRIIAGIPALPCRSVK